MEQQQQTYQIIHSYNILHRLQEHHLTQTVINTIFIHIMVSFSSLALIFSSVSMANLRYLLATTFSSLSFLSNSFHHLPSTFQEWPGAFLVVFCFRLPFLFLLYFLVFFLALSFSRLILSLSFLCCSVSEALFALSFSFVSELFFQLLLRPC